MVDVMGLGNMAGAAAPPLFQSMFFLHEAAWWSQVHLQGLTTYTHPVEKNVARQAPMQSSTAHNWTLRYVFTAVHGSRLPLKQSGSARSRRPFCATRQPAHSPHQVRLDEPHQCA